MLRGASRPICLRWPAWAAAAILGACSIGAGPAGAQDAPENVITVHPSAVDPRMQEALLAEERLERRLKRSNELLRAICVGCGARDAVPGAPAFNPAQALRGPDGTPSQMLIPHALPDQVIVEIRQVPVMPAPDGTASPAPAQPAEPAGSQR